MPNLGGPELIIVLLIFVLLFGAKKLPDLGSSVGKSIKNFKKGVGEGRTNEDEDASGERVDTPPATQSSRDLQ
ncbi:MAG: twin-arginine translocase TatA/TatE family subunit [Actinomycetota bacterium]|jgi:sec-independent protein translocase protein TatA|nr:twin-arginine translocase TatA/TatE family subunit [Actinomycetota bacterium]